MIAVLGRLNVVVALIVLASCAPERRGPAATGSSADSARWVVYPKEPGPDLPPAGRSLFDFVTGARVPFPFTELVRTIEKQLGGSAGLRRVLIPLGRSLQRSSASPEFFRFPRAVLGVDSDSGREIFLKDRLFLGYQEKAEVIEVISYNEAAGRFEFQLVKDYRHGTVPQLVYASRVLCGTCHQNLAPIFSRPLWDETNGNHRIASLLAAHGRKFYDFPVAQGIDVPNLIDDATDRANLLSAAQLIWREGCADEKARAQLLIAALQYRLTGGQIRDLKLEALATQWRRKWPGGLHIPNPDIPNRDPLVPVSTVTPPGLIPALIAMQSKIEARFEPTAHRAPLETWSADRVQDLARVVPVLAGFFTAEDIRELDRHLADRGGDAGIQEYRGSCRVEARRNRGVIDRVIFSCGPQLEGVVYVAGARVTGGVVERLDGASNLGVAGGEWTPAGGLLRLARKEPPLTARSGAGRAIESLSLSLDGEVVWVIRDDFARLTLAIDAIASRDESGALGPLPFRRATVLTALRARLGLPQKELCCLAAPGLPPPRLEARQ